jgi:polyisoprenoid-binding protein YceI
MQASSRQMTARALQTVLADGSLTGEWILDPRRSSVQLKSRSMGGLVRVTGVFGQPYGDGIVSPDGEVSGTLTVATASIDTKNERRDAHLRSADFFDSGNHPDITFTAEAIRPSGQGVAVAGTLTVRGCTRPLSVDALATMRGEGEVCLDAEVIVNRGDFGLTWNPMRMVSMNSILTIHATFTRW